MADDDLEQMFRNGLHELGEGADVTAPVAAAARSAVRRRRTGRVVMAAAAASIAAVAVTGVVLDRDGSGGPGRSADPPVVDQPSDPVAVTEWRTEYWHDMQVDVPASWGWGTAPMKQGSRGPYLCGGPGAMVLADGRDQVNPAPTVPYVGRPIMLSDLCVGGDALENPKAPYVWLGAEIEPGSFEVGNGYTQETVEVAGTTLTVATNDAELRREILESAGDGGLCPAGVEVPRRGLAEFTDEGVGDLQQARVCAYDVDGHHLVAASPLRLEDFARMEEALGAAPSDPRLCKSVGELVVVTGWYADPYTDDRELWLRHDRVFELGCGVVDVGDKITEGPTRVRVTDQAVDAWRSEVYEASLSYFIGTLP